MRIAGEHLQGAHGAESAVDEESEVVGFDSAGVAGFHDDGRFAADGGGVIEVAAGGGVRWSVAADNDVIEGEGEGHIPGGAIVAFPAGGAPEGVGAAAVVRVAP